MPLPWKVPQSWIRKDGAGRRGEQPSACSTTLPRAIPSPSPLPGERSSGRGSPSPACPDRFPSKAGKRKLSGHLPRHEAPSPFRPAGRCMPGTWDQRRNPCPVRESLPPYLACQAMASCSGKSFPGRGFPSPSGPAPSCPASRASRGAGTSLATKPFPRSGQRAGPIWVHGAVAKHMDISPRPPSVPAGSPRPPEREPPSRAGVCRGLSLQRLAAPQKEESEGAQSTLLANWPFPTPGRGPARSGFTGLYPNTWTIHRGPLLSQPAGPGPPKGCCLPGPGSVADFRSSASLLSGRRRARACRACRSPIGPFPTAGRGPARSGFTGLYPNTWTIHRGPLLSQPAGPGPPKGGCLSGPGSAMAFRRNASHARGRSEQERPGISSTRMPGTPSRSARAFPQSCPLAFLSEAGCSARMPRHGSIGRRRNGSPVPAA